MSKKQKKPDKDEYTMTIKVSGEDRYILGRVFKAASHHHKERGKVLGELARKELDEIFGVSGAEEIVQKYRKRQKDLKM